MFSLHIVLPTGTYLKQDVDAITLPTQDGQRTLLANHMATVLPIETGLMYLKLKGEKVYYFVSEGAFTLDNNVATLMVRAVENQKDIDFKRAERAKIRAEERLHDYTHTMDMVRAEAALKRALTRLRLKD